MATPPAAEHRDLEARFRKLEQAVKALAAAVTRRPKFEVSSGDLTINGGDLVVDGGDFLLLDTDGSTVFRLGPQEHGDRGVSIYREDGPVALSVSQLFEGSGQQEIRIMDRFGNEIVGEESLGSGLSAPWLSIPLQPVMDTPASPQAGPWGWEVPVATTAWTTAHQGWFSRTNQFASFRLRIAASDTTTAAEARVVDAATGTVLGQFLEPPLVGGRAAGSTDYAEVLLESLVVLGSPNTSQSVQVQVRRTAGAGTLRVAVPESRGGISL